MILTVIILASVFSCGERTKMDWAIDRIEIVDGKGDTTVFGEDELCHVGDTLGRVSLVFCDEPSVRSKLEKSGYEFQLIYFYKNGQKHEAISMYKEQAILPIGEYSFVTEKGKARMERDTLFLYKNRPL